jgi:hypothetical protein
MQRWWRPVDVIVVLLALSLSVATWLATTVRLRSRAAAREADWRRAQAELLAEMDRLRDEAERARIREDQAARDTYGWADGYKQGCDDMIRAVAALSRGAVAGERAAGGRPDDT